MCVCKSTVCVYLKNQKVISVHDNFHIIEFIIFFYFFIVHAGGLCLQKGGVVKVFKILLWTVVE